MRVEYQDRDGSLIYAYVIGSLLLSGRYWPDRGGEIELGSDENPTGDPNYAPLQPNNLRRDFNGDELFLESRKSNPLIFEASMDAPLGSSTPVSRVTVHLICDFAGGATGLLARASTREASATAQVPTVISAETP